MEIMTRPAAHSRQIKDVLRYFPDNQKDQWYV